MILFIQVLFSLSVSKANYDSRPLERQEWLASVPWEQTCGPRLGALADRYRKLDNYGPWNAVVAGVTAAVVLSNAGDGNENLFVVAGAVPITILATKQRKLRRSMAMLNSIARADPKVLELKWPREVHKKFDSIYRNKFTLDDVVDVATKVWITAELCPSGRPLNTHNLVARITQKIEEIYGVSIKESARNDVHDAINERSNP